MRVVSKGRRKEEGRGRMVSEDRREKRREKF